MITVEDIKFLLLQVWKSMIWWASLKLTLLNYD